MDPIGNPVEFSKFFAPRNEPLNEAPPGPGVIVPPAPGSTRDEVKPGMNDEILDLLMKQMQEMNARSARERVETLHSKLNLGFDPLWTMPMPGSGLFAPSIGSAMRESSFFMKEETPPPMDLSTAPSFLAAGDTGTGNPANPGSIPTAGTAMGRALGLAARLSVMVEIPGLVAKLTEKEMTLNECAGRLEEIAEQVRQSGDPVATFYLARILDALAGGATGLPTEEGKKMIERAPSLFVEFLGGRGASWCPPLSRATGDTLARYLKGVKRKTGDGPPEPGVLKSLAHLACELKSPNQPDINAAFLDEDPVKAQQQSTISRDEVARGCAWLIKEWWEHGRIEIREGQKILKPGDIDLARVLTASKVRIHGTAIELPEPPGPQKNADVAKLQELFKGAGSFSSPYYDENVALVTCRNAVAEKPELAAEALGAYVDTLRPGSGQWFMSSFDMSRLMSYAGSEPWLRDLLLPQVERIKEFTTLARESGTLTGETGRNLNPLYEGIEKNFPGSVDGTFMEESLVPLLFCGDGSSFTSPERDVEKLIRAIWKRDPSMVSPTISALLAEKRKIPQGTWDLVRTGANAYGWKPGPGELDLLAARLSNTPVGPQASLFDMNRANADFPGALGVLRALEKKNPGILKGLEMPGSGGISVPLARGLAERILADNGAWQDLGKLMVDEEHPSRFNFMENLYPLLEGSGETRDMLAGELKKALLDAGSLDAMGGRGKTALALLCHMKPAKSKDPAVREALAGELYREQADAGLQRIVNYGRKEEIESLLDTLAKENVSPERMLQEAGKIVTLACCSATSAGGKEEALAPGHERLRQCFARVFREPGGQAVLHNELSRVEKSLGKAGAVGNMPLEDIRALHLLLILAREESALEQRLAALMEPEHRKERIMNFTPVAHPREGPVPLYQYRRNSIEHNLEELRNNSSLTPPERHALDLENDRNKLGFDSSVERGFSDATMEALFEGVTKAHRQDRMAGFIDFFNSPGEAHWAYSVLARVTPGESDMPGEWERLRSILDRQPDEKSAEVNGFSYRVDENGEETTTPLVPVDKKMKKNLHAALSTYLSERAEVVLEDLNRGDLTRPERVALVRRSRGFYTDLYYGNPSGQIVAKAHSLFAQGLRNADPSTMIEDLPDSFNDMATAYEVYTTLAPGAERDEEIGPEWQKFKGLLTAFGGEKNLDMAMEAYDYGKEQEQKGFPWERIQEHIYTHRGLGEEYRTLPIGGEVDDPLAAAVDLEETDDEFMIDGIRLRKNTADDD